jgi:RNA polymerase sigma-70 factor, ECF subfamily
VFHAEARLRALMLASLGGDAQAYRKLLQELSVYLRAYYRRRLPKDGADAEDLVQETLIAVDRRRVSYDATQPFTPWVFAIARYRLVDHLRRSSLRMASSLDGLEELFGPDNEEQAATELDVARMLAVLPDRQREAIRMTRLEGRSIEETAQLTGQSESAIKVGVHRGLKRLRGHVLKDSTHADD